jgi:5-methyltetrahydrofolate--homocysteine methyltransferase
MSDLSGITNSLIAGDEGTVINLVQKALNEGADPKEILNDGLIKGMDIVGERMEDGEMFIPEVLMSAKVMTAALDILKPLLAAEDVSAFGKVVIGTVKGDLHDIGKNLVMMMLESSGFQIKDLGADVTPEAFVAAVKENEADILALSALLTTTMPMMQQTINAIEESGLREKIKVIVGGAPVNQKFADKIGADGYAPDAGSASKLLKTLIQ